jgi:hypothetical protein
MTRLRALLSCCAVALVLAGVGGAANSTSFVDRTGDAELAPDIAGLDVTNDDAGTLTFRLTFGGGGLPGGLPGEDVGVAVDVDQNPDTGTVYYGTDVALEFDSSTLRFYRAQGNGFSLAPAPASLQGSLTASTATFTVKAADLGLAPADGFNVVGIAQTRLDGDLAPDIRTVNYQQVAGTPAKPAGPDTRAPVERAFPAHAVHGKLAELDYAATDGRAVTADTIRVYRKSRLLRTIRFALGDTNPFYVYYTKWRVPRKLRGRLRYCVRSVDAALNASNLSCARLTIR